MDQDSAQPAPRQARAWLRARRIPLLAGFIVIALLGVSALALHLIRQDAQSTFDAQYSAFLRDQESASDLVDDAQEAIDGASAALDASANRVFDEAPRTALASAIDAATARVTAVWTPVLEVERSAAASATIDTGFFSVGNGLRSGTQSLASFSFAQTQELAGVPDSLSAPLADVAHAVAEWNTEQQRIIDARYVNHVHAVGSTAELDECKGSVDLTATYDDVPTIAEHWSCGGKDFPDGEGTIITLTGERSGTYRVEGIVKMLNQHTATVADLPRGWDLIYQTCQNGQSSTMSFTALTRLGDEGMIVAQ